MQNGGVEVVDVDRVLDDVVAVIIRLADALKTFVSLCPPVNALRCSDRQIHNSTTAPQQNRKDYRQ
jgi:hypothetical protein